MFGHQRSYTEIVVNNDITRTVRFTDLIPGMCLPYLKQMKHAESCYNEVTFFYLQVLEYTAGHINYGGRVTDDWDRRCIMNILNDFYNAVVLEEEHQYSESGIYRQIPTSHDHNVSKCPENLSRKKFM